MRCFTFLLAAAALPLSTGAAAAALPGVANETAKLLPDNGTREGIFGSSVAISGITAIVRGRLFDGSSTVYLFDTTTSQQVGTLVPDEGAGVGGFGLSIGISGTTAIVGAFADDDNGDDSGSAYLFDTTTGQQIAKLLPNDGAADDFFGLSVGISGNIAIVGAFADDDNGSASGSAYLFDTATGHQITKLLPSDGAADDLFGRSVAISGNIAIVGAFRGSGFSVDSTSAYIFDTTTGQQIAKLLPNDGARFDFFARSVAISGTTAIVGAHGDDDNGDGSGSAYLFDTTTGRQIAKLFPSDGAMFDTFGKSVAISGTTAIVGAGGDDDSGDGSGSAYLFDTTTGQQIAKLLASDGAAWDSFGSSVAIGGTSAIVGAPCDDDGGECSGSAYIFDWSIYCAGDLSGDGQSDLADYFFFSGCMGGPEQPISPGCEAADMDRDGDADQSDFALLQNAFDCR